jgi:hypothetical protein
VIFSKHFHALLNCNKVLRSIAILHFAIRYHTSFASTLQGTSILVMSVFGKNDDEVKCNVSHNPQAMANERALAFSCPR